MFPSLRRAGTTDRSARAIRDSARLRRQPLLEHLEGRLVLSNVAASVCSGSLSVTAPAGAVFALSQSASGSLVLTGAAGTTVNGRAGIDVGKIAGCVSVSLGAGDVFTLDETRPITVARDLSITSRGGSATINTVNPSSLSVGGSLTVLTRDAAGDSVQITLGGVSTRGDFTVAMGRGGGDTLDATIASTVKGRVLVTAGDGAGDLVNINGGAIAGSLCVQLGDGADDSVTPTLASIGGNAVIMTGNGADDAINLYGSVDGFTRMIAGDGAYDTVNDYADTAQYVAITVGDGAYDSVLIAGNTGGAVAVVAGDGTAAMVNLNGSVGASAFLVTGKGAGDSVSVDGTVDGIVAYRLGAPATGTFVSSGGNKTRLLPADVGGLVSLLARWGQTIDCSLPDRDSLYFNLLRSQGFSWDHVISFGCAMSGPGNGCARAVAYAGRS